MPPELPGLYFDPERNRYFPDPQSRRGRQHFPSTERTDEPVKPTKLKVCPEQRVCFIREVLQLREIGCDKTAFQRNVLESQATHPKVWTYGNVVRRADAGMEWLRLRMPKEEGEVDMAVLFVGGSDGSLGIWRTEVNGSFSGAEGRGEEASHSGQPETLVPSIATEETPQYESYARPPLLWKSRDRIILDSAVRTVQRLPNGSDQSQETARPTENVIVTTFGKEGSWGTVFVLALQPRTVGPYVSMPWQLTATHTMHGWTIWTSECNPRGGTLAIGTSMGASLLELECSIMRTLLRSSSAVLSQQFDSTGNVLLSGFRNGVISTIDIRLPLPPPPPSAPSTRPYSSSTRLTSRGMRHHFVLKDYRLQRPRVRRRASERTGSMYCSHSPVIHMSSSVCSMRLLRSDENYILAGAMDGTLQRWDRRMVRDAVMTYEGHVNSHTTLPLSLDPSETLLFAGGEDCKLRIWSVSSGRLLSTTGDFDSPLSSICWRGLAGMSHGQVKETKEDNSWFGGDGHPWGCWFGAQESISYVHGCG